MGERGKGRVLFHNTTVNGTANGVTLYYVTLHYFIRREGEIELKIEEIRE